MRDTRAPSPAGYWPQVVLATVSVVLLPLLIISVLEAAGWLHSPIASFVLAIVSSVAVASAGSAYWTRRGGSKDIVFGDLMVWSWLRRMRTERQLKNARHALGLDRRTRTPHAELSPERQAEVLERLAGSLEARDLYTHGHSSRVTRHSHMIAKQMGLPSEQVEKVRAAAAMHDVGKLNISRSLLNKPGKLTDEEFDVIKRHPVDGAEMVAGVGDAEITAMVRHHHERLDGCGYPEGLRGEEIPLGARIIAVADTFDAITSSRPYRPASQHKKAIAILKEESGRQLDSGAVNAFLSYYSGRRSIARWALVTTAVQRLVASLAGPIESASASSIGHGAVTVAACAALGTSLVSPAAQADGQAERTGDGRAAQAIEAASFITPSGSPADGPDRARSNRARSARSGDRHEPVADTRAAEASEGAPRSEPAAGQRPDSSNRADDPDREDSTAPADRPDPEDDGEGKRKRERPAPSEDDAAEEDSDENADNDGGSEPEEEDSEPDPQPAEDAEDGAGSGSGSSGNGGSGHGSKRGRGHDGDDD